MAAPSLLSTQGIGNSEEPLFFAVASALPHNNKSPSLPLRLSAYKHQSWLQTDRIEWLLTIPSCPHGPTLIYLVWMTTQHPNKPCRTNTHTCSPKENMISFPNPNTYRATTEIITAHIIIIIVSRGQPRSPLHVGAFSPSKFPTPK